MPDSIRVRRGTTAKWADPLTRILEEGEFGLDYELHLLKVGDGSSEWDDLYSIPLMLLGALTLESLSIAGTLTVTGDATFSDDVTITDDLTCNDLIVAATAAMPSNTTVGGVNVVGETWIAPTLTSSWANYGTGGFANAGYRRRAGYVKLRGAVKSGGAGSGNPIFTLPAGYRPAVQKCISCPSLVALTGVANIIIDTSGLVYVGGYASSGTNAFVSLDGIEFELT